MIFLVTILLAYPADVISCHDGDTCTVDITLEDTERSLGLGITQYVKTMLRKQIIRLCDIDAPELATDRGPAARDKLLSLIQGKKIEVRLTGTRDKYGRLLGYILADGVELNSKMRETGFAVDYMRCK